MCGILLSLILRDGIESDLENAYSTKVWTSLIEKIKHRGPSSYKCVDVPINGNNSFRLSSSVLSLREPFTEQPIVDENHFFQFNGELYNQELFEVDDKNHNDTQFMYRVLTGENDDDIIKGLRKIRGEYAFTFYDRKREKLWFGRDCIGRRSLLYSFNKENGLIVTSVPPDQRLVREEGEVDESSSALNILLSSLKEVPGGSLFCLDLKANQMNEFKWQYESDITSNTLQLTDINNSLLYPYSKICKDIDSEDETFESTATNTLQNLFESSIYKRIINIPEPKNVHLEKNSPHIAILFSGGIDCTLLALYVDKLLPPTIEVDLLNVSFENKRTGGGFNTPDRKLGRRSWRELYDRRIGSPYPFRFRFIEINVPFEEMSNHRPNVQSLMYPKDTVMDLSIAIAFYFASRGKGLCMKMSPETNEPYLYQETYTSTAPVLLSGLGADELFGGYTRHTTSLRRDGYTSLSEELQLDFSRLHERNLGRDDRVCATWGKEVRYPFLDEQLINWTMNNCPLRFKVYHPKQPSSEINFDETNMKTKYILRLLAQQNSLLLVSEEKKRAIQFGAKTAKMQIGDGKSRGTDILPPL